MFFVLHFYKVILMSAVMSTEVQKLAIDAKPRFWKKAGRFLLRAVLLLVALGIVAHLVYKYSGSRRWELVAEQNGMKLYSMKVPGQNIKKFMAEFKLKASPTAITAFLQDQNPEIDLGFYGGRVIEDHGPQMMVTTWKGSFPRPFKDRDFVGRFIFTQDPKTKEVTYMLQALPDFVPPEDCCVRMPRMDNTWQITPRNNGMSDVRWVIDMDVGGFMPYFLINQVNPEMMTFFASKMQSYVDRPKYLEAKIDWISELPH